MKFLSSQLSFLLGERELRHNLPTLLKYVAFLAATVAAYSMAFQTSTERNRWLPRYLAIYNGRRVHMALTGRTPFQQLGLLRATE